MNLNPYNATMQEVFDAYVGTGARSPAPRVYVAPARYTDNPVVEGKHPMGRYDEPVRELRDEHERAQSGTGEAGEPILTQSRGPITYWMDKNPPPSDHTFAIHKYGVTMKLTDVQLIEELLGKYGIALEDWQWRVLVGLGKKKPKGKKSKKKGKRK